MIIIFQISSLTVYAVEVCGVCGDVLILIHMGTISCFMVIGAYSTGCISIATSDVMTKFIAFVTSLDIKSIMYFDGGGANE